MHILLDADAAPVAVKEILFRAVERTGVELIMIANVKISHPSSKFIRGEVVPHGPDEADDRITDLAEKGDLVITSDIPLADRVIEKGALVITPRGELFSKDNIKERLVMRDLMDQLRSGGVETGGPPAFSNKDKQNFANRLTIFLEKNK